MIVKKLDSDEINILINEIKELADKAKHNGKSGFSGITSKDVLFYFLAQFADLDRRVTKIETTEKLMCWFIGISISLIGLMLVILA